MQNCRVQCASIQFAYQHQHQHQQPHIFRCCTTLAGQKLSAYLEYPVTVKDEDGSAVQRKYNVTLNVLPKCIDVRETPGPGPNNQWVCHLSDTTLPNI